MTPMARIEMRATWGRPRLGDAGGTWRSIQPVGLYPDQAAMRRRLDNRGNIDRNRAGRHRRHNGGCQGEAPHRRAGRLVFFVAGIVRVMHMPRRIVPGMDVRLTDNIAVNV